MQSYTTVAIDAMGGDHGLNTTLAAAVEVLERNPHAQIILVGDEASIRSGLHARHLRRRLKALALGPAAQIPQLALPAPEHAPAPNPARLSIRHAAEVVAMDDPPATALKNKRQSSMRLAIELVRDGHAQAAVSAGNTGALMAIARFVLRTLEGIDRPAIAAALPGDQGQSSYMLDLGANVDCSAEHLRQFAFMGSALVTALGGPERPTVGLLNVGEEMIKGNEVVKQASELLRDSGLNFIGNVEGNEIFRSKSDVIVCDGFVGNVALKTSEGLAQMLGSYLKQEFTRSFFTRLAAIGAAQVLRSFVRRVDHRRYNGAALLGLKGIVFKSHGSADAYAFRHAIERALSAAAMNLNQRIAQSLPAQAPVQPQAESAPV